MEIIREVTSAVEDVLKAKGLKPCFPFYVDDVPCHMTDDCDNIGCPFKKGEENGKIDN